MEIYLTRSDIAADLLMNRDHLYMNKSFFINTNVDLALELTDLALDELELIVGRFRSNSIRAGLLRGKVVVKFGQVEIRKCFGNKLLWRKV